MPSKLRFSLLLSALWWGSLTALGGLVVPLLFQHLGSPQAAGAMAAKLFAAQTWLSIGCAMLLLMLLNKKDDASPQSMVQAVMPWVVAGLFLAVLVEFGVAPRIVNARATGGDLRLWHGLGSAMYLGHWLSATLVLWRLTNLPAARPATD
jgi:hypothetical protein